MRKRSIAAVSLAAVLVLAVAPSAFGEDTVTQVLNPGTRTASNANLTLNALTYSHSDQTSTGTLTLTADDSSGTGLGWNVTIQSSALVYSGTNGGSNIAASNFSITSLGTPVRTAGQTRDTVGGPNATLVGGTGSLDSARKVISANPTFGQGTYTQANGVSLTIPGGSKAGTYTATLTTTISAGP